MDDIEILARGGEFTSGRYNPIYVLTCYTNFEVKIIPDGVKDGCITCRNDARV